jgi:hypothetical protein
VSVKLHNLDFYVGGVLCTVVVQPPKHWNASFVDERLSYCGDRVITKHKGHQACIVDRVAMRLSPKSHVSSSTETIKVSLVRTSSIPISANFARTFGLILDFAVSAESVEGLLFCISRA